MSSKPLRLFALLLAAGGVATGTVLTLRASRPLNAADVKGRFATATVMLSAKQPLYEIVRSGKAQSGGIVVADPSGRLAGGVLLGGKTAVRLRDGGRLGSKVGDLGPRILACRAGKRLLLLVDGRAAEEVPVPAGPAELICAGPRRGKGSVAWHVRSLGPAALVREWATAAAEVPQERAFISLEPVEGAPPIEHLLVGHITRGRYVHLVNGATPLAIRVPGGEVTTMDEALNGTLLLSRAGKEVNLYVRGRPAASLRVPDGPIEVACAWANDAAGPWRIQVQDTTDLLFTDDFMRYTMGREDGWTVKSGRWWIEQEAERGAAPNAFMLQVKPEKGPARALTGHPFWCNYRLSVAVSVREAGALGLLLACRGDGHRYRLSLSDDPEGDRVELVRVDADREMPVATARIHPRAGRWTRLSVRVRENGPLVVSVDGVELFRRNVPEATFGRVGLCAQGTGGRFDDFEVRALHRLPAEPAMRRVIQCSKTFHTKPRFLKDDRDDMLQRWASDTDAWVYHKIGVGQALRRGWLNSTLLFTDFRIRVAAHTKPRALALHGSDGAVLLTQVLAPATKAVEIVRSGEMVSCGGIVIGRTRAGAGLRVGYYDEKDVPFTSELPEIFSRTIRQEFFETAPVAWMPASGEWRLTSRWQCKPKWNFFGGVGTEDVILFGKNRYDGLLLHERAGPEFRLHVLLRRKRKQRLLSDERRPRGGHEPEGPLP